MAGPRIFLLIFLGVLFVLAMAAEQNITIDDQFGDEKTGLVPVFTPPTAWTTQACSGCAIRPDLDSLYKKTFTAATFTPNQTSSLNSLDFTFNGTAIYIFFTLFNYEGDDVPVNTECNFTIDGKHAGFFNHTGDSSRRFQRDYKVPVFTQTGLEHAPHHVNISVHGVDYRVLLSFDYAVYTTEGLQSSPRSRTPRGAIAGGVLGGLVLVGVMTLAWLYYWPRRRQKTTIPNPFKPYATVDGSYDAPLMDTSKPPLPKTKNAPLTQATTTRASSGEHEATVAGFAPPGLSRPQSIVFEHPPEAAVSLTKGTHRDPVSADSYPDDPRRSQEGSGECSQATIVAELLRLREEVTSLKRDVSQSRLTSLDEPPPTYAALQSSGSIV